MPHRAILFITILLVILTGSITFWFLSEWKQSVQQVRLLEDSVRTLTRNQTEWLSPAWSQLLGPKQPGTGDSLLAWHRIIWTNQTLYLMDIRLRKDSSIWMEYRRCEVQNPLTHQGKDEILFWQTGAVDPKVWATFYQKLAAIPFLDAVQDTDYFCCFDSGGLRWEAYLPGNQRLQHSTWCRQSVSFAEACESLLRLSGDPYLLRDLGDVVQ